MPPTRELTASSPIGEHPCPGASPVPQRSWRLVLLGTPDVVNPLLTAQLAHALGACLLFTGETFRAAHTACAHTSAALAEMDACTAQGNPVEDGTVMLLLRQSRACLRCKRGFLIEGFPRTLTQARALDALLAAEHLPLDAVLYYESLDEPLGRSRTFRERRISDSVTTDPTMAGVVGDLTPAGHPSFKARGCEMLSVAQHYRRRGLLLAVNGSGATPAVFHRTLDLLAAQAAFPPLAN